jgi:ligand-binding sensor domain-containing protein
MYKSIVTTIISVALFLGICETQRTFLKPNAYARNNEQKKLIAGHSILKVLDIDSGLEISFPEVIFQDSGGRFWIGGGGTISAQMFEEQSYRWTTYLSKTGIIAETTSGLHYLTDSKLPENVGAIVQGSRNKVWFSPRDSFSRECSVSSFDGSEWQQFNWERKNTGPCSIGIFAGQNGTIWVWLDDLLIKNTDKGWSMPITVDFTLAGIGSSNQKQERGGPRPARFHSIYAGLQDREGILWLGTSDGVISFDEKKKQWKKYSEPTMINVSYIYQDRKGRIWFASGQGLVCLHDKTKGTWKDFNLHQHLPPVSEDDPLKSIRKLVLPVREIYQDREGKIMFATNRGLAVYSESEESWKTFTYKNSGLLDNSVNAITEDKIGRIWVAAGSFIMILEP